MTLQPKQNPNFFVVGTVKGGTTALHRFLLQHPQVYMSPIKETNYFSRFDMDPSQFSEDYLHDINVDLETYLKGDMEHPIHIAHITEEEDYLSLFSKVKDEIAIGEVSNSYLPYNRAPKEIFKQYPNARIIMMLRHPAERAYSQYMMNLKQGKILEKDFIKEITEDDAKKIRGWGANHQYLFLGEYYGQVKHYLDIFPKEQVGVFLYEEYKADTPKVLDQIFSFLGVNPLSSQQTDKNYNTAGLPRFGKLNYWLNQSGIISWAKRALPHSWRGPFKSWMYKNDIPPMSTAQREWLLDYYKEDVIQLQHLIQRDLTHWLK